jgi:nicotinamidase-related amidase
MKLDLEKILNELEPYREGKATVKPKRATLLVIDMQNYFYRIIQLVLQNILKIIQAFRQANIPIIFTQHGHTDPPSDGGVKGSFAEQTIGNLSQRLRFSQKRSLFQKTLYWLL